MKLKDYAGVMTGIASVTLALNIFWALTTWDAVGVVFMALIIGCFAVLAFYMGCDLIDKRRKTEKRFRELKNNRPWSIPNLTTWEMIEDGTGRRVKW